MTCIWKCRKVFLPSPEIEEIFRFERFQYCNVSKIQLKLSSAVNKIFCQVCKSVMSDLKILFGHF